MWSVHERTLQQKDRTNNYAEAAHRRLQNAFKCDHPPIWRFIDKLREEQKQVDANYASFVAGREPPPKAKMYREIDARILRIVQRYVNNNAVAQAHHDHNYNPPFNPQPIIEFLTGISHAYLMES